MLPISYGESVAYMNNETSLEKGIKSVSQIKRRPQKAPPVNPRTYIFYYIILYSHVNRNFVSQNLHIYQCVNI